MENRIKKDKCCRNCKYFLLHYVKTKRGYYPTSNGHCTNNRKFKMTNEFSVACDYWELCEKQEEIRKSNFRNILLKMARRVEELAEALEITQDP